MDILAEDNKKHQQLSILVSGGFLTLKTPPNLQKRGSVDSETCEF